MSALSIQPTYPIFTDIDGQPLEDGYVWIGTANLDPQTNPINVYWDAALTLPAAQPIRTQGGYPVNSGTPARLYVNSDYSIRVMNRNGSVVYSASAATERYSDVVVSGMNAEDVVYDPPFTGGVQTNVEAKLAQLFRASDTGIDSSNADVSPIVCAIRNNGAGSNAYDYWKVIDYSGHAPIGITNVAGPGTQIETTTAYIRVNHAVGGNITAGVVAVLDETLAQTGIRLGTSVGADYTDIYMYRDIAGLITKSSGGVWNIPYSNGIDAVTWDAGNKYLVVDHKETPNAAINVTQQGSGSLGTWIAQTTQISSTQTRIYFMRNAGLVHSARIAWNGSAFATAGNAQNISVTSYDTGTGDLVLTLTDGNDFAYDVAVTAYNQGTIRPVIKASDATTVTINFYDLAGTKITASPTTACAFVVRAQSRVLNEEPGNSTSFAVRWNSRSQINPQLITAADYPAGNIWVLGWTAHV